MSSTPLRQRMPLRRGRYRIMLLRFVGEKLVDGEPRGGTMADQISFPFHARVVVAAIGIIACLALATPIADAQGPTCAGEKATIVGTNGDDKIVGTDKNDVIVGLGGDDVIYGGGGKDLICGRSGKDTLRGGPGDDLLVGASDNDKLYGGPGDDSVFGGTGNDVSYGGAGDDTIFSYTGNDRNYGGPGDDGIDGGSGDDVIRGGSGNMGWLFGSGGDDQIVGGSGYDQISGGPGNDVIKGRGDIDLLDGDGGNDTIYGGPGDDYLGGGPGDDKLAGGPGKDAIEAMQGADRLFGGDGNDELYGGADKDEIYGGAGKDLCDRDGAEKPASCESVSPLLAYRTIQVNGSGSGIDPTGSYFGDRFYDGATVRAYSKDITTKYPVKVYQAVVNGPDFKVQVPSGNAVVSVAKDFGNMTIALGEVSVDDATQGPLKLVMVCCNSPLRQTLGLAEMAQPSQDVPEGLRAAQSTPADYMTE